METGLLEKKMASVGDMNKINSTKSQGAFAAAKIVLIYRHGDALNKQGCCHLH
jgi:hypothetical protein